MRALSIACSGLMLLSALGTVSPVFAQQFDKSFYIGAGALAAELEPRVNQSEFVVSESLNAGGQLFLGGDLTRFLSLEGYYRYLGESELTRGNESGSILYQTAGVSGLLYVVSSRGHLGLRNRTGLMLYGRAGVGYLENTSDDIEFVRLQSTHIATGVGLEYGFNNGFALRAEFLNHDADARDINVALIKRFGRKGERDLTVPSGMVEVSPEEVAGEPKVPEPAVAAPPPPPPPPPPPRRRPPPPRRRRRRPWRPQPPPPPIPDWDADDDGILDEYDSCADTKVGALVDAKGCAFSGILKGITFASGSDQLTDEGRRILDEVAHAMSVNPKVEIAVEAHTDNRGEAVANMKLSQRRSASVVSYLADTGGVDLARMKAVGFGESRPVQSNRTAAGRTANRRVEIRVD
jgi:outer membrane protein OmpA-like peptidoglycan-associated protein/opacity protein-like surface antigen